MAHKSQAQLDREREARINAQHFDPRYIGEGGPMFIYQSCSFVSGKYRENYDKIKWKKDPTED